MARRTFLRFTRADQLDAETLDRYLLHFAPATLYHDWQSLPHLSSQDLFFNTAPLELEIGCGSAEFLCALAEATPTHNFVGVDISGPSLNKAVEIAAAHKLENIRFIHADFHLLYPLVPPASLYTVYLHFPDPHLKPGHQKRRIFNQGFLDKLAQALQSGGKLSVMTDVQSFFMDMLEIVEQDARFVKTHSQRYLLSFEPEVKSHFQRIWEKHGEDVYRFEVRQLLEERP